MIDYARTTYQPRKPKTQHGRFILARVAFILFIFTALAFIFVRGFDQHFEAQDRMLCRSAKISSNREWLEKCQCFYEGESIKCIQRKEKAND